MLRATSIATYRNIVDEGLLPKRRMAMYKALYRLRQGTSSEVAKEAGPEAGKCPWKRIGELVKQEVVSELPDRLCSVTGQPAIVYALTDELPKRFTNPGAVAPKPSSSEMQLAVQEIRRHIWLAVERGEETGPELVKLEKWLSASYEN